MWCYHRLPYVKKAQTPVRERTFTLGPAFPESCSFDSSFSIVARLLLIYDITSQKTPQKSLFFSSASHTTAKPTPPPPIRSSAAMEYKEEADVNIKKEEEEDVKSNSKTMTMISTTTTTTRTTATTEMRTSSY
jgi:hypothetical protein